MTPLMAATALALAFAFAGPSPMRGQDANVATIPARKTTPDLTATPVVDSTSESATGADAEVRTLQERTRQMRITLGEGARLMRTGDEAAAESQLELLNESPRGTWEWHMESVASLLRVAFANKSAGDIPAAQRAARRVLARLSQAETLSADDSEKLTNIEELRGMVQEQFTGDTGEAVESYRRAVRQADRAKASIRMRLDQEKKDAPLDNARSLVLAPSSTTSPPASLQSVNNDADAMGAIETLGQSAAVRLRLIEGTLSGFPDEENSVSSASDSNDQSTAQP